MYSVTYTGQFKKSLKRCVKRGLDLKVFTDTLDLLQANGQLPPEYKPHRLVGDYDGCWECHMRPNWLLIWRQNDTELELVLIDTGSHSDLF
jgi:mRNA interferase YafQ